MEEASSCGRTPYRFERMEGVERVLIRCWITASRVRCDGDQMWREREENLVDEEGDGEAEASLPLTAGGSPPRGSDAVWSSAIRSARIGREWGRSSDDAT